MDSVELNPGIDWELVIQLREGGYLGRVRGNLQTRPVAPGVLLWPGSS